MLLFSFTGTGMFAHPLLMCFKVAWLELSCFRTACVHITTDFLVWYSFYLGVDLRMRPVLIPPRLRRPNSHHRSDLSSLTFIHVLWVLISSFYKNKATVRFLYLTLSFKSLIAKFVASAKGEPLEEHDYLGYTAASWQRQHWEAEEAWASTAGGLSQSSPHSLPSCVQPQPWNRPRMTCIAWEAFCWEVWDLPYASLRSRFFTWSSGAPFSSWFLTVCFGHTFAPRFFCRVCPLQRNPLHSGVCLAHTSILRQIAIPVASASGNAAFEFRSPCFAPCDLPILIARNQTRPGGLTQRWLISGRLLSCKAQH